MGRAIVTIIIIIIIIIIVIIIIFTLLLEIKTLLLVFNEVMFLSSISKYPYVIWRILEKKTWDEEILLSHGQKLPH